MEIKPEDRFMLCKNMENEFCKVKNHYIENGFASKSHCGSCNHFINSKEEAR